MVQLCTALVAVTSLFEMVVLFFYGLLGLAATE